MRFTRSILPALVFVVACLLCLAVTADAAGLSSLYVGPGNFTVKTSAGVVKFQVTNSTGSVNIKSDNAVFTVENAAGADKFTIASGTGNTAIAGTLTTTGATVLNGGLTMDTNKFTVADTSGNTAIAGTLAVTGAATLNGGLTMDTDKFTVADTSGNTAIGGTLNVTGATTLASTLSYLENLDSASLTDGTHTVAEADKNKCFLASKADGATTVTLPAPAAGNTGWKVTVIQTVDQNLIITGTADKMICLGGDGTSQTCTFSTASEKVGATAICISTGSMWIVIPLVGTATVT